ncbi:hypothetical protein Ccrd_025468 [Cynara cardunculus var. scolymus]|uniref:Uncharacterized protein n=1 Tax=Cynara cardunculus var. scolymus TaxID=59895 RepID=A0A103X415_CYNCS|nr:hypothetical protein Ccrd_025468 [Cynara cardunculus var. scolymus]
MFLSQNRLSVHYTILEGIFEFTQGSQFHCLVFFTDFVKLSLVLPR